MGVGDGRLGKNCSGKREIESGVGDGRCYTNHQNMIFSKNAFHEKKRF